jgi:hypothetical protein
MATKWNVFTNNFDLVNPAGAGSGDVIGPSSSTDDAICRFSGTTGKIIQNSGSTLSDTDLLSTGELNLTTDLAVQYGGSGASTFTDGAYLIGSGTGAFTALDGTAKGSIPVGDGTTDPTILAVGTDTQVLTADSTTGTGVKWAAAGGGNVSNTGTPVNNQIAVWTDATTIEGDSSFLWDGTGLKIEEVAAAAADTANFGQIWVKNTTPNQLWFTDDAGTDVQLGVGAGNTPKEFWFGAESLQSLETNFAVLTKLTGTTVKTFVRDFANATSDQEEYANSKLQVPGDVDTSGTVTFTAYVMAATAAASKNIALTFGHLAVTNSEDFDGSYTDEDSGDKAIDATQDDVTKVTWTETISNLGWVADDLVFFRISRPAASANDLVGTMYLFSLSISIPRSV